MKKRRIGKAVTALLCTGLIILLASWLPALMTRNVDVPGLTGKDRVLLRIWALDAPGGALPWLRAQLRQFEKQHPGVSTWLRTVSAQELTSPETIRPDVVLYMPGNVTDPAALFLPLSGDMAARETGPLREELLRCGRWKGAQYGLPVCWSAWVLAIDSALEPGSAVTPAPTTLLGRPAVTAAANATPTPGYPLEAAVRSACGLQSPGGAALFTLSLLLEEYPPLPEEFGSLTPSEVYAAFQKRQCATAMLTTGQATAFTGTVSGGSGFPFRIMTADEVITDQVWLASVTADAPREAALLLSHLASADAQKGLSTQGLYTVRDDLTLYVSGMSAEVETASRHALSAVNAYLPTEVVQSAAWQCFQGTLPLSEALLPLM